MRKLIFIAIFFGFFATLKLASANDVFANASLSGNLDNRGGGIDINVTVNYKRTDTNWLVFQKSYLVTKGTLRFVSEVDTDSVEHPPYSVDWSTNCNIGSANMTGTSPNYSFVGQDVHCTTTNSTVTITGTSCPSSGGVNTGHVDWQISNVANANISNFKVFKALNAEPDTDTSPITVNFVGGQAAYSSNIASLAAGSWNVKVKAYPPNNDPGISVSSGSFFCGTGISNPSNLNANASCQSFQNRVDFNWSGSTPGTFNYEVQTNPNTDPGSAGAWTGITLQPSPVTNTYISTQNQFTGAGATHYWRVKATPSPATGQVYYSGSSSFTTLSYCSSINTVTPPRISRVKVCDDLAFSSPSPDPNKVKVEWTSANSWAGGPTIVPGQEFVDYGTNNAFTPGAFSSLAGGPPQVISFAFVDDQTYHFRIRTKMTDGKWYISNTTSVLVPGFCQTTSNIAPYLYGYADCPDSGPAPVVHLQWNSIVNDSNANFTVIKNASFMPATYVASGFVWDSTFPAEIAGAPNSWQVVGDTDFLEPRYSQTIIIVNPYCTLPEVPDYLSVDTACDAAKRPLVNFTFRDRSLNETGFWLEVSSEPFTSAVSTNPNNKWALKALPAKDGSWQLTNYQWSSFPGVPNFSGLFDSGDANFQTTTTSDALTPRDGVTYYWRVKATTPSGFGTYVYDDGSVIDTLFPAGKSITAPLCQPLYDLKAQIDATSWFNVTTNTPGYFFQAGNSARVNVIVSNVGSQNISPLPTTADNPAGSLLWFFYTSAPTACTATAPIASTGQTVPLSLTAPLAPGSSVTIPVTFTVGSTVGATAYADVAPTCNFLPDGIDPFPENNVSGGATYNIGINKFFETLGGDVGAKGTISVGVNSSAFATPLYQSQYLLAGGSVGSSSSIAPGGFKISNYSKPQVASGGVYRYFADRYKSKAMVNTLSPPCSFTDGATYNGFYYCAGDMTLNTTFNYAIKGNSVFFVDGNLNINNPAWSRWILASNDTAVFVVKGDINVPVPVYLLHGVFITRKSFNDCLLNACSSPTRLEVTGAVYADGEESGGMNLRRYFSDVAQNATTPVDKFTFAPKYLVALSQLLSQSPVGWKEVAP